MRNLLLILFFALTLSLTSSYQTQAQTEPQTVVQETSQTITDQANHSEAPKLTFFEKIGKTVSDTWGKAKEGSLWWIIGIACGFLSKNGAMKFINMVAGKTTIYTEVGINVLSSVHNFSELVDKSIKDDYTVDQNSLKEAWDAGKTVVVKLKEGTATLKPDKV